MIPMKSIIVSILYVIYKYRPYYKEMSYINIDPIIRKSINMGDTPFNGTVLRYLLQNDMTFVKLSIINQVWNSNVDLFLILFSG